jgi:hypothetical protein
MDGKRISIVIVLALELGLETLHAAMPFGRLMPIHYSPGDVRTITVSKSQETEARISFSHPFSAEYKIKRDPITEESRDYIVPATDTLIGVFLKSPDGFFEMSRPLKILLPSLA